MKCPRCGETFKEHPALSRRESTDICPPCGMEEAYIDSGHVKKSTRVLKSWKHDHLESI